MRRPRWHNPIHATPGTGDASIYVTVAPNSGVSRRSGDVVIAGLSGVNPEARITVNQAGR